MNARLLRTPSVLVAVMLVGGGLLLSGCTSESPPNATADSTDTASPTTTVAQTPSSDRAGPATAAGTEENRSLAEKLADASVETKVKRALIQESSLRVFPFRPTVTDGHLILRGDVNTRDQYRRAERIAGQVEGVTALTNQLTMDGRPVTEARLAAKEDESEANADEEASVYHTVRRGDTLWKIARQYRASVEQIRRLNDLRTDEIDPGQRVRVR